MFDTNLTLTQRNGTKHRATPEASIRLIYAGSATMSNDQKHSASDYEQRRSQVRVLPSAPLKAPRIAGFYSFSNRSFFVREYHLSDHSRAAKRAFQEPARVEYVTLSLSAKRPITSSWMCGSTWA